MDKYELGDDGLENNDNEDDADYDADTAYQACAEERELPDVDEGDGGAGVDAEDAHAGERRDHAREEGEEVREGGHLQEEVDEEKNEKAQ